MLARRFLRLTLALAAAAPAAAQVPDWQNESLPFERRAADLVARMTLEEKASQMIDRAAAIQRLGVPEYNWWNEALHGVARAGLATSFPQAIGLAATWDDSLMYRLATVISDEARAKHHEFLRSNQRQRYQGLTFWSPNINLFRDPRWGRGQETYGEDPFLTGRLAVQFIRGLQGDDPKYLKTVATVKHYAVHSGPEPERHTFNAVVSERDLRESYLPHFEAGIREGGAYSLMCAYNRIYGQAACENDLLIRQILRGEWKFPGYIVSDCGAIDDIYLRHKVVATAPEAAAIAVKTGTDLDCGRVYLNLVQAVRQGLITEAALDTSLVRLFLGRFKLGMFDAPEHVRWASIPYRVVDQPSHRELARQAARESMVLLKNDGVLPLRKNLGTIAVIGPNADETQMLLGNYNGIPADPITPLRGIREALPNTRVLHSVGSDLAEGFPVMHTVPAGPALVTPDGQPGLRMELFNDRALQGAPVYTATVPNLDVNWDYGAPRPGMNPDTFGVRWTGELRPSHTGTYRLGLIGTVKYRLFLNDSLAFESVYPTHDGEFPDPRPTYTRPMQLEAGKSYRVRIEGDESYGTATLRFLWSAPHEALRQEALQVARQADAVVLFLGLTARMEGEEMRVDIPGFRGGDRTSIDLPATQQQLLEQIVALGKPTVLVLLSGSALAVPWADEHVPAILEAWYPGQAAGQAIADVLFGDYNPAGRLPVTFYRSTADLPPFEDYAMKGRTYRFFQGKPLYAFGHGLSYTTFRYDRLATSAPSLPLDGQVTVRVNVTNTGQRAGDEVVQLYVAYPNASVERPIRDLRGYQRVSLQPGETRTVALTLAAKDLAYWDPDRDRWVTEPKPVRLEVGSSSADIRLRQLLPVGPAAR